MTFSRRLIPFILLATAALTQFSTSALGQNRAEAKRTKITSPATGRVKWRLQLSGTYSFVRPVIGPSGNVYAVDNSGRLYAISPTGTLLWTFVGAGNKGVDVGADGTIYTASEDAIRAIDPSGTLKWRFDLNPRAFITLGVNVGPDGNIYSVATESIGVFSLTPQGAVRWSTPEQYSRPIVEYGEIVFGYNGLQLQLYFYANARIRALRAADGGTAFPVGEMVQPFGQPDVSTVDQTVHANVLAYTPNGDLLWKLFNIFNSSISFPACDVANNGIHYVVYPGQRLYAVNLDGSIRYQVDFAEPFGNPVASPDNGTLVIGSDISGSSNSIVGFNASNGVETWRETLPPENGAFQFVTTRARFTPDSSTAYVHTATAGNSAAAFLYAVDARPNSGNLPPHAVAAADRTAGHAPITIQFDGTGSSDPDGSIASYLWDFADGTTSTESQPRHNFSTAGTYRVKLTVTDNAGATAETYLQVEFTPGGCVSNCARVSAIRLMTWRRPAGRRVVGTVVVANENGQPLAGVTVKMVWAVPNRPTVPVTLTTDANGIATTTVSGAKGTYTLFTALIDAAGYTFDEGNSVSSRSITR